jgi:mannosyl-3-phosphoglycerate phosphatase family protein
LTSIAFPGSGPPAGIVFTDLDGTLLDFHSYAPSPEAVDELREMLRRHILVIPVSSKTADEIREVTRSLPLSGPAIAEGGAVVLAADGSVSVSGPARSELVGLLRRLQAGGWPLRGMSEMSVEEVVELTGLDAMAAERAMTRVASEPFIFSTSSDGECRDGLDQAVAAAGAALVRGGRFWHLHGIGIDKGAGVRSLLAHFSNGDIPPTAAIGDAWNDLPMFEEVDLSFVLGDAVDSRMLPKRVIRVAASGPSGFVEAVQHITSSWSPSA